MVHFGLDLTYACNYRCPYCALPAPVPHRPVKEWLRAWERVHRLYGRSTIYMSGGEPSVYPGFYDLVRGLAGMHKVDVCTNLSWDVARLLPELSPEQITISATFHPTQVESAEFLAKAERVKDYLPKRWPPKGSVYFVAHPGQMGRMAEYAAAMEERGLVLVPLPLMVAGEPGNSEEEKKAIAEASPNKGFGDGKLEYQLKTLSPEGRLCRAGQRYAHIRGDGGVSRCTRHEDRALGDFFSEGFRLRGEPERCSQAWCPFESQWVETEG
jgi:MoaA/NifB/PqqE/SkfB family radical SAM enzyme